MVGEEGPDGTGNIAHQIALKYLEIGDATSADAFARKAFAKGHVAGCVAVACGLQTKGHDKLALLLFRLTEHDSCLAQLRLAILAASAAEPPVQRLEDLIKSPPCHKLKHDSKSCPTVTQALYTVGRFYETGQDVKQDFATAIDLYQKTANQLSSELKYIGRAKYSLGVMAKFGIGLPKDSVQADKFFEEAKRCDVDNEKMLDHLHGNAKTSQNELRKAIARLEIDKGDKEALNTIRAQADSGSDFARAALTTVCKFACILHIDHVVISLTRVISLRKQV